MRLKPYILSLLLVSANLSASAFASSSDDKNSGPSGFYLEETFFPVYVSKNDTESPAGGSATKSVPTQTGLGIDTHTTLGVVFENILLGFTYNYYDVSSSRPRTNDYEGLQERTTKEEWGGTVGVFIWHFRLTFTDFFNATKVFKQTYTDPTSGNVTTDETHKNTAGAGYQIGLGYEFNFGGCLGLSPTLLYRHVEYSKQSYNVSVGTGTSYPSTELVTKAIDSELQPMITLSLWF